MKKILVAVVILLVFCLPALSMEESRNMRLPAAGLDALDIDCGAGFLHISAEKGLEYIELDAVIRIRGMSTVRAEEYVKENAELFLKKLGSRVKLVSRFKKSASLFGIFRSNEAVIDLQVRIPQHLAVKIHDGSGEIRISDLNGELKIRDGSGSIILKDLGGRVYINDGSGNVEISGLKRELDLTDGSGNIKIEESAGNLTINDGSGSMEIAGIGGDVNVTDGSGEIVISRISGSVKINDGSGSIHVKDVKGNLEIVEAGSGSVSIKNVKGRVIR